MWVWILIFFELDNVVGSLIVKGIFLVFMVIVVIVVGCIWFCCFGVLE